MAVKPHSWCILFLSVGGELLFQQHLVLKTDLKDPVALLRFVVLVQSDACTGNVIGGLINTRLRPIVAGPFRQVFQFTSEITFSSVEATCWAGYQEFIVFMINRIPSILSASAAFNVTQSIVVSSPC
jgi:hypothetical protein